MPLAAIEPRSWAAAYGLVPIGILSLLLISAQSVTSITSERDLGSLDLLIITDITPKEFIYGKILGILYNTKEYIVPPLVMVVIYGVMDQLGTYAVQGPTYLALAMVILIAFTIMLGIHVALRNNNTRLSALNALGTVFFLSVGTMVSIYLIIINGRFEYQWFSFAGFIVAGDRRALVGAECRTPFRGTQRRQRDVPDRRLLHDHQHPDRQTDDRRIDRSAHSADRDGRRVWFRPDRDGGAVDGGVRCRRWAFERDRRMTAAV